MSIAALIELSKAPKRKLTVEEIKLKQEMDEKRFREQEERFMERFRCGDCGADTLNYSHSFSCRWRGVF